MLKHVAIIMDGNGRWAKNRGLDRSEGHKKGARAAEAILEACAELKIPYLTLYTFSSENWRRPEQEVEDLMNLLRYYLEEELDRIHSHQVRIRIIGDRQKLPKDIREGMNDAEKMTASNKGLNLQLALSYGGRQEIMEAAKWWAASQTAGETPDEKEFAQFLYTKDIPDPDLLIRTGGDQRISNFLLWQLAYTELYFSETLWPDFTPEHLREAIQEFERRERRYGGL